jgi:hypothetical protein
MIKIFSKNLNTYFHDIFDNGKNGDPRYFHIFTGTNNRFAVAYPLVNKSGIMVLGVMCRFVKKYQPVKLTSDHESGFVDKNVLDYLKTNGVEVKRVHDQNHSTLGIIDRFTRTLRDMNEENEFTVVRMNKLIDVYNNTYHTSIGMTPKEMFSDIRLKKEYIDKCVVGVEKQKEIKDFELEIGSFVRYILPVGKLEKRRLRVSKDMFQIAGKDGNQYILMARDGTVILRPRYMLVKDDEKSGRKFAETIEGKNTGMIDRVIEEGGKNHLRVAFKLPDGSEYIEKKKKTFLR